MTDESDQTYPFTVNTLLDRALGSTGYYGAFNANMHTDQSSSPGADAIVASAKARGVPVVTAAQMLTWLDGRNGSTFNDIAWSNDRLSFRVARRLRRDRAARHGPGPVQRQGAPERDPRRQRR